jgi:predicted nucleic acid-binding protein
VLCKLRKSSALLSFTRDAFEEGEVSLIHLEAEDTIHVVSAMEMFNLDFDDAYQYVCGCRKVRFYL